MQMKIVEILCHPRPGSFNLALAASARETLQSLGHEVILHDLYKEGFDPVLERLGARPQLQPRRAGAGALQRACRRGRACSSSTPTGGASRRPC